MYVSVLTGQSVEKNRWSLVRVKGNEIVDVAITTMYGMLQGEVSKNIGKEMEQIGRGQVAGRE